MRGFSISNVMKPHEDAVLDILEGTVIENIERDTANSINSLHREN